VKKLLSQISQCAICAACLPHPPRPVLSVGVRSRILIVGQAPGRHVHDSGVPWQDRSGDNLRTWLGVEKETFYDSNLFALMPMGFCYPGKGKSGDLPPRPECAPHWHPQLLALMKSVRLTLLIGQYSQAYYLSERVEESLTGTVQHFRDFLPQFLPLPHPSPRNGIWLRRNPWFEQELLPVLKTIVSQELKNKN
jgi:uracil-DNA glycosylase